MVWCCIFGLLFFASITSTLALATFGWFFSRSYGCRKKEFCGLRCYHFCPGSFPIIFFSEGVFDEYDYWVEQCIISLRIAESILFIGVWSGERMETDSLWG
jgi:SNF family Na+-dependent transporter